jgi:hypothetical protein
LLCLAAILLADVTLVHGQITPGEAVCRSAISTATTRLGFITLKAIDACVQSNLDLAGSPVVRDCGDFVDVNVVSGGALALAIADARSRIISGCNGQEQLIPRVYANCPSPADGDDAAGATAGVDNFAELARCETTVALDRAFTLRSHILDPDRSEILANPHENDVKRCAAAIGKFAAKLWKAVARTRGNCQFALDKASGPDAYACFSFDNGRIATTILKVSEAIRAVCGASSSLEQADRARLGSCDSAANGITSCVIDSVVRHASGTAAAAFEFGLTCPASLRTRLRAGGRDGSLSSRTRLDAGWSGGGHGIDLVDGALNRFDVACSSNDCSSCTITASCDEGTCRCSNDSSVVCATPFVAGGPCGPGICLVHAVPPLALSLAGAPTCVLNTIHTPFAGTVDLGTGASLIPLNDVTRVYIGLDASQPCPVCSGSAVGAAGTCSGGARDGLPCVTDGLSSSFGNTSYDCPPLLATNISGAGLKTRLFLTDGTVSMPFADACDAPLTDTQCACGACSLDPLTGCRVDNDCSSQGLGSCTSASGTPRQPNGCLDLNCDAGVCSAGPLDTFCDGLLTAKGTGYIPCTNDSDCVAAHPAAGSCTLSELRSCFANPIVAIGQAGTDGTELVSVFCSAVTTSGGVNSAAGLPGPGRVVLDLDLSAICSDGITPYEFGGANCP